MPATRLLWVLGFALGLAAAPRAASADEVGFVAAVTGSVEIRPDAGTSWTAASADTAVHLGDTLRTGRAASVKLVLADDSVLVLDEETTLVVDKTLAGGAVERPSLVRMLRGRVRATIGDAFGERLELHTTTAVVGVKGTRYEALHVDGPRAFTRVCNLEGHIVVTPTGGDGTPSEPAPGSCSFAGHHPAAGAAVPFGRAGAPAVDTDYPPLRGAAPALPEVPPPSPPAAPAFSGEFGPDEDPVAGPFEALSLSGADLRRGPPADDPIPETTTPSPPEDRGGTGPPPGFTLIK